MTLYDAMIGGWVMFLHNAHFVVMGAIAGRVALAPRTGLVDGILWMVFTIVLAMNTATLIWFTAAWMVK